MPIIIGDDTELRSELVRNQNLSLRRRRMENPSQVETVTV